jgi:hypothetical protein
MGLEFTTVFSDVLIYSQAADISFSFDGLWAVTELEGN